MNATTLGVVAGVVVFAIGGLHGLVVLTAAVASWWAVRSALIWLAPQKQRAETGGGAKRDKSPGFTEQISELKSLAGRRSFAIILALLLTVSAAMLATRLGFDIFAQRAISPLAAFGWLVLMLTPVGLVSWVFVQLGQERGPRYAEQEKGQRQREEGQRGEAERRAQQTNGGAKHAQSVRPKAVKSNESAWLSGSTKMSGGAFSACHPRAETDEIRFAYHRKIKQCHPDKVAGLAPEFVELAERHTRTLNAAYYEATRARGESAAC